MPIRRMLTDPVAELSAMSGLTERVWTPRTRWHVGDLAWARFEHLPPPRYPAAGWWDGDDVVAWGRVPVPGHLELQVDPAAPGLTAMVLDWFESLPGHLGLLHVTILDAEAHVRVELERRGYRRSDEERFFIHLIHDLTEVEEPDTPPGYRLRPVAGEADAANRAAVHAAAFGTAERPSKVTADSYRNVMAAPTYRRQLDWIVEHDGRAVAFCLAWLSEPTKSLCLEPVGCDPEHRRLGLASAAVNAALRAGRDLGAGVARVCARGDAEYPSARSLYRDVGFTTVGRNETWQKPG